MIPTFENTYVTMHCEQMKNYHVEDPLDPMDELVYYEEDLGYYNVLAIKITLREYVNISWKMNFDGANSKTRVSARVVFISPKGDTLCHVFHL
jgi:hypothetical protein